MVRLTRLCVSQVQQPLPPRVPSAPVLAPVAPPQMRPLREVARAHLAEHGAVLAWRRRVAAEHAAASERAEDEALTRYTRNASLLTAVFADDAHGAELAALAAGGSAAEDAAALREVLEEMKERYGDVHADDMETDGGPQPADLAPEAARGAAQAAARAAALQRFVATTQAAHVYPQARPARKLTCPCRADVAAQLAAAVAEYEAAVGVSLQVRLTLSVALLVFAGASAVHARGIGAHARCCLRVSTICVRCFRSEPLLTRHAMPFAAAACSGPHAASGGPGRRRRRCAR